MNETTEFPIRCEQPLDGRFVMGQTAHCTKPAKGARKEIDFSGINQRTYVIKAYCGIHLRSRNKIGRAHV